MARYLITQSLLSSWAYTFDCPEGSEQDAQADFLRTLHREKTEPTEAMMNGLAFEDAVYARAAGIDTGLHPRWETGIQAVADILRGAPVQVRASCPCTVEGVDYLVYGVLDALKAGIIYDVKFSNTSFHGAELCGKYLHSPQHPFYFYLVPEAREFRYLVSDGRDVYVERYTRDMARPAEEIIREFIKSIEAMRLIEVYQERWAAR